MKGLADELEQRTNDLKGTRDLKRRKTPGGRNSWDGRGRHTFS